MEYFFDLDIQTKLRCVKREPSLKPVILISKKMSIKTYVLYPIFVAFPIPFLNIN